MHFRLIPNSVTLNDLERRNSHNLCVISPNSVAFWGHYVKVVDDTCCHRNVEKKQNQYQYTKSQSQNLPHHYLTQLMNVMMLHTVQ